MSVALIDADIVVYKAGHVAQNDIDWGDGEEGKTLNPEAAVKTAIQIVKNWTKAAKADKTVLAFSDRTRPQASFRYLVLPSYHGTRKEQKPDLHDFIANALKDEFRSVVIPGLEGDDVLGIMATSGEVPNAVIVSPDKDLAGVPAPLLSPERSKVIQRISPLVADRNWMTQTLTGDSTDGYKGCPLIGPVKAKNILLPTRNLSEMWDAVFATYVVAKAHKTTPLSVVEKLAIQQARVARILRHGDYNKDTGEVRLWHPRKEEWINPASSRN